MSKKAIVIIVANARQRFQQFRAVTFLLFLITGVALEAQTISTEQQLTFHLDKTFYVNGEVIWHQVYLPESFKGKDVVLKLSLTDRKADPVAANYLKTEGKTTIRGYFKLPYNIRPDVYHLLVIGTDRDSKKSVKLGELSVPIYNDLEDAWKDQEVVSPSTATELVAEGLQLNIQLTESAVQKRGEVDAAVQVTDAIGQPLEADLSISVCDDRLLPDGSRMKRMSLPPSIDPTKLENAIYIKGRLLDLQGNPRSEVTIAAYAADERNSYFADTDQDGYFSLQLPDFTGDKPLQFVDLHGAPFQVLPDDGITVSDQSSLTYTTIVKNYLEWSRHRKMIYQLYQTVETSLQVEQTEVPARDMEPDYHIQMKEYTAFPDLYTFLMEVSTPLKLSRESDGSLFARMFNPDPRVRVFYQEPPIFIVDGKVTRDVNFLQQLDIEKLEVIDEFFDFQRLNTYFGKLGSYGVVMVETSIPNLQLPEIDEAGIFTVGGLLPEAEVLLPEQTALQQPVFKPQLFWQGGLTTDEQGRYNLQFPHTDDLGTFTIEIVARGRNGKMGKAKTSYRVSW